MNPAARSFCNSSPIAQRLSSSKRSQALLHQLGVGSDVKGVLGDLPRYAGHVRGAPHKDICVGAEKVDEHHFLFAVEGGTDLQCLFVGASRVEGHLLDTLGGLEASRVSVRGVQGLACHLVDCGCEGSSYA